MDTARRISVLHLVVPDTKMGERVCRRMGVRMEVLLVSTLSVLVCVAGAYTGTDGAYTYSSQGKFPVCNFCQRISVLYQVSQHLH